MSESSSKQFKVTFTDEEVNVKYGELVSVSADRKTVQDAISGVAGALGLENCLKLGAAAAAIFVTTRSIAKNLPWVEDTEVQQDNVVEITAKPGKEEKLAKLVASGGLEKIVKSDFENLEDKLDVLLGEEICEEYGKRVLELIKDIRIGSITTGRSTALPEDMAAGRIIRGHYKADEYGQKNMVFDKGTSKGLVVGEFIDSGAKVEGKRCDGENFVGRGFDGAEAAKLAEIARGNLINVKIIGSQLSQTFERGFKATATICEVRQAVLKAEQKTGGSLQITRGNDILPDDLTIGQAQVDGSTVNWKAKFQ